MWRRAKGKKYGNTKIQGKTPGHWFDSQLEKSLFDLLSLKERAGEIRDLSHHPGTVFLTKARIQYRPDFRYTRVSSEEVEWAEAKGFETPLWRVKRKLWIAEGPGKLHIYRGSARRLILTETLNPKGEKDD